MSEPLGDDVEDAPVVRDQRILRQSADAESGLVPDDALLRREIAADDLQKRRLTCAVAADHADALARFDAETGLI